MQLGFIGTGNIGNRFALKLIDAGHDLHVYDIREEATANLREKGAKWAKGPAAVAKVSEVIFSSLPSPAAVERVVFDEKDGLLREIKQGKVYVDMSTSTRKLARRIAEACEATGAHALDSPVTQGGVYATVGGDKETFELCRPLFETISDHVYYVGEAGQGQVAKLVRQYVGFTSFITMAEALTIAANAGADTAFIASFINATTRGGGGLNDRIWPSVFDRDFGDPGTATATLDIVSKDVELAVELAREVGGIAGTGAAASDVLKRGQAQGWGRLQYYSAVQILEKMAHVEFRGSVTPLD